MTAGTILLVLVGLALGYTWLPLALLAVPPLIWLFAFFRDPERTIPTDVTAFVSPADGTVSDIGDVDEPLLGEPAVRVGIFLSVFNVHINRSPTHGRVRQVTYKKGKFVNALHHDTASEHNESNTIVIDGDDGRVVAVVRQICGLIARRIICTKQVGDTLSRGERLGMIKFGSRTELTIPKRLMPEILVTKGQKVRAGTDVIARVRLDQQPAPTAEAMDDASTPPVVHGDPADVGGGGR